jgi:hypothetical protein
MTATITDAELTEALDTITGKVTRLRDRVAATHKDSRLAADVDELTSAATRLADLLTADGHAAASRVRKLASTSAEIAAMIRSES